MSTQTIKTTFKLRRGSAQEWTEKNPILAEGEPGFSQDTNQLKIGNNITPYNDLPYLVPFKSGEGTESIVSIVEYKGTPIDPTRTPQPIAKGYAGISIGPYCWSGEYIEYEKENGELKLDENGEPIIKYQAAGDFGVALGYNTVAAGEGSFAANWGAKAIGEHSAAFGADAHSVGRRSFATGATTRAIGENSSVFGNGTQALGKNSIACSHHTQALGENSIALGEKTIAKGKNSFAGGVNSVAEGNYGFAFGSSAKATSGGTLAIGTRVEAVQAYSIAFGLNNTTNRNGQMVIGLYANPSTNHLFAVGNGTKDAPSNAFSISSDGSITIGGTTITPQTIPTIQEITSLFRKGTGQNSIISNNSSGSSAQGKYSYAGGINCKADADYSFAYGMGTQVTTKGAASATFGGNTIASNQYAFASGVNSQAQGLASVAMGRGLIASASTQAVFGAFNIEDKNAILIIGNGIENTDKTVNKSNAFMVNIDGSAVLQRGLTVGAEGITIGDKLINKTYLNTLVTEENVNNIVEAAISNLGFAEGSEF